MDWKAEVARHCRVTSFGPPCSPEQIEEASRKLALRFPDALRSLYLAFDGLRGPTNAAFLWSLAKVVDQNLFVREEEWAPSWLRRVIIFGDDGIGGTIGIQWAIDPDHTDQIIEWCLGSLSDRPIGGSTVFEVWRREQERYDEAASKK
jgi:hypothetical protein